MTQLHWIHLCVTEDVKLADYHEEAAMLPHNRTPTHPGEILIEEFLIPLHVTQFAFAAHLGVSVQRVDEPVRGKRGVTLETACLLSQALGTTPEFWMNLQAAHDLGRTRPATKLRPLRDAA